jgi:amino acid transporter, AAT family
MTDEGEQSPKASSSFPPNRPQLNYGSLSNPGHAEAGSLPAPSLDKPYGLHRGLSARQVQMIAVAGTIGTGLFLGTGRSLAQGGPASILICYALVGFIVYVTLLLLGEMATQYPVAGAPGSAVESEPN